MHCPSCNKILVEDKYTYSKDTTNQTFYCETPDCPVHFKGKMTRKEIADITLIVLIVLKAVRDVVLEAVKEYKKELN